MHSTEDAALFFDQNPRRGLVLPQGDNRRGGACGDNGRRRYEPQQLWLQGLQGGE